MQLEKEVWWTRENKSRKLEKRIWVCQLEECTGNDRDNDRYITGEP